jgi:PKD repeat protein
VVTFTGEATGTQPVTFTWDLGDGYTAGGMTTTHAYAAAGDYPVVLTVSNSCGQQSITRYLTVTPAPVIHTIYLPLVVRF